jgi:hypothetical protein
MQKLHHAIAVVALVTASSAAATTVTDPVGDFIPSFTGPQTGDLDVTSFSVVFDPATEIFAITGVLAANINPESDYYYVTGVNTGTGLIAPFGSIGEPNVIFNQAVVVGGEGEGEAFVGANDLDFTISGNTFQMLVPLSLLPSTGAEPLAYAFNLWPRTDLTPSNLAAISDFAPNNAEIHASAIPEPGTWLSMLAGFAFMGGALRYRRRRSRSGAALTQQA